MRRGSPTNSRIGSMLTVHGSEWGGDPELRQVGGDGEGCLSIWIPHPGIDYPYFFYNCLKTEKGGGFPLIFVVDDYSF